MTRKQRRKLSEELSNHRGRWVAVREDTVVDSAKTLDDLARSDVVQPSDRRLAVPARHREPYLRR